MPDQNDHCNFNLTFYFIFSITSDSENLEVEESIIVIGAIKKTNIPKFVASDVPLFNNILDDLFPGLSPPIPDNVTLRVSDVNPSTKDTDLYKNHRDNQNSQF